MSNRGGRRGRDFWIDKKRKYETSGLSRRQFCLQENISLSAFDYWRNILKQEQHETASAHEPGKKKKAKQSALIPVVISDLSEATQAIQIRTVQGHVVSIPVTVCPAVIQQIFRALGGS